MSDRFEWDDTNSSGIWWSTNVSIRDECILLKEDTECDDSDIVELLRSIAKNIEDWSITLDKFNFNKICLKTF